MRKCYLFVASLLVLFLCSFQHVSAQEFMSMEKMEEQLLHLSDNLMQNSKKLTEELQELKKQQEVSKQTLQNLTQSYESILDLCNDYATQLDQYKWKLQEKKNSLNRLMAYCVMAISLFVMIRIAIIILKAKGIELNYWINTLL